MKKLLLAIVAVLTLSFTAAPTMAYADWSYGTAKFKGNKPSKSMSSGNIKFFYNGTLKKKGSSGTTEIWECTGDCCIIYPKNNTRKIKVNAKGKVQEHHLK